MGVPEQNEVEVVMGVQVWVGNNDICVYWGQGHPRGEGGASLELKF